MYLWLQDKHGTHIIGLPANPESSEVIKCLNTVTKFKTKYKLRYTCSGKPHMNHNRTAKCSMVKTDVCVGTHISPKVLMSFKVHTDNKKLRLVSGYHSSCKYKNKMNRPHDKTNKMTVRPAKTQISLGLRPV